MKPITNGQTLLNQRKAPGTLNRNNEERAGRGGGFLANLKSILPNKSEPKSKLLRDSRGVLNFSGVIEGQESGFGSYRWPDGTLYQGIILMEIC